MFYFLGNLINVSDIIINIFSFLILIVLLVSIHFNIDTKSRNNPFFRILIYITEAFLLLEIATFLVANNSSLWLLHTILISIFFMGLPLIAISWIFYIAYETEIAWLPKKWLIFLFFIPFIADFTLSILSSFIPGLYFTIDRLGVYHRDSLFNIHTAIVAFYLLFGIALIYTNRAKVNKKAAHVLILFSVPPVIGSIVQIAFYGVQIIYPMVTLSILLIFIFIQTKYISTDYLTGTNNRRYFDNYLASLKTNQLSGKVAGLLLDIDNFKPINDLYGHLIGDHALVELAAILKASFDDKSFIARVGGDEFFILFSISSDEDFNMKVQLFNQNIVSFNDSDRFPFKILLSYGAAIYDDGQHKDMRNFINRLDRSMYKMKKNKKQQDD